MKKRRILSAAIAIALMASLALSGCSGDDKGNSTSSGSESSADSTASVSQTADDSEDSDSSIDEDAPAEMLEGGDITLTFFDKNTGNGFTDPVAQKIIEETGVNLEIQQPTGDPEEKLNLMLASGDLPDIVLMDRRSDIVKRYIAAGGLIPLNELIDEFGPNITEMYGDVLNKSRYPDDGLNYYLNNWYGVDPDPDRGINIRMDLLQELGYGDKAMAGEYFSQEEFIQILKEFKEKYPDEIPFTLSGESMESVYSTFRGMYGMKFYYEDGDQIKLHVRDPRYLEMMKFISGLYRDGLIDKEWAVNNSKTLEQKLINGTIMATAGVGDANKVFKNEEGPESEKQYYMFKVVAEGTDPDETTFSPRSSLGWDAIGITATNEYPEETMKFMDYLAKEEGQYMLLWGLEGEQWEMVDGKHKPIDGVLESFQKDWDNYSKDTGARKWLWFVKNGYGTDGTPYDMAVRYELDKVGTHARISMKNSVWDTAVYDDLGPTGGTPQAVQEQVLKDVMDAGFTKMAFAESEEEVETLYNAMIAELDSNNAADIEKIFTENYEASLKLQGLK